MGAVALAVLARRDLRSIGPQWTGTPQSPMIARERQVADLVARGHPDDGAATALQVSVKTIEKHVGDIYRRLGVDSRASLAAVWPRS